MTGRELIVYIMENGLEDEQVLKGGKILGFVTVGEAATRIGVGVYTTCVLIQKAKLDGMMVGNEIFISESSIAKYIEGSKNNE